MLLIKGGIVVNHNIEFVSDILLENNKIISISKNIECENCEIIDAQGKYVMPGGIDPHVHMELDTPIGKSADDFYSGTRAALYGGTTTIIDFVTPNRNQSYTEALKIRIEQAKSSVCDYKLHLSPTWWGKNSEDEILDCYNNFGINSFKIYLAYKQSIGIEDNIVKNVLKSVKKINGVLLVHCEDGDEIERLRNKYITCNNFEVEYHYLSRPDYTEFNAVKKLIEINKKINCKLYIVHVSSYKSISIINEARKNGMEIYAETCLHYLLFDNSVYHIGAFLDRAKYVLSPPIRDIENQNKMWEYLLTKSIDTIGTDHCPFTNMQKLNGINDFTKIPNGAGGVENRIELLFSYAVLNKGLDIKDLVKITSYNQSVIFNIKNKGHIEKNFDADLIILNKNSDSVIKTENQMQNTDNNIYDGFEIRGNIEVVIKNGLIVKEKDNLKKLYKGNFLIAN